MLKIAAMFRYLYLFVFILQKNCHKNRFSNGNVIYSAYSGGQS